MSTEAAPPPLRVGLVGAGWVTQFHLAGWQRLAGRAKVVAIADPGLDRARARAVEFDIGEVFARVEDMLGAVELDAIDVAAPREFHAGIVRLATARGLAVLCQKPLAPSLDEAAALVEEVQERQAGQSAARLMVHENWRFRPYYRDLASWLSQGAIGEVVQAQMTLFTSGLVPDADGRLPALERQPFIATLDRALVMEILIHHIDTLRYLLGELALKHARLGHASPAMKGEDRAFMSFETGSGAPVALMANLAVHGRAPTQNDRLTLIGTRGTIELEGDTLRCLGPDFRELRYDMPSCYLDSYAGAIAHFVDCLRSGHPFETSPDDNLRTLGLVEQIYALG